MQRSILATIAFVILALSPTSPADLTPATARKNAPDFSLEDSKGALIKIVQLQG